MDRLRAFFRREPRHKTSNRNPPSPGGVTLMSGTPTTSIRPPANAVVHIVGPSHHLAETARRIDRSVPHSLDLTRIVPETSKAPALERATMTTAISLECSRCSQPGIRICSGCRSSRYCSADCRDKDWPIHELLCYSFKDFITRPPCQESSARFIRAVLFPADSVLPSFAWIRCTSDGGVERDGAASLLGDPPLSEARMQAPQGIAGKPQNHSIEIVFRENFHRDGSLRNKSIDEAAQGKAAMEWRGNVVAIRYDNLGIDPKVHGDMTMEDVRQVVMLFARLAEMSRSSSKVKTPHTRNDLAVANAHPATSNTSIDAVEGEATGALTILVPPVLEELMTPAPQRPPCSMCTRPSISTCSGCRSSQYCSATCRDLDLAAHMLLCASFQDFVMPPLSNDRNVKFKRAVLFPADAESPRFAWLKCTWNTRGYEDDDAGSMLGQDKTSQGRNLVQKNLVRGKELDHTIDIVHRDNFKYDGSLMNKSIQAATQGNMAYPWAGNVVAARRKGPGGDPKDVGNMTMEDFRHAIDYFAAYNAKLGNASFRVRPSNQAIVYTPSSPYGVTVIENYRTGTSG